MNIKKLLSDDSNFFIYKKILCAKKSFYQSHKLLEESGEEIEKSA